MASEIKYLRTSCCEWSFICVQDSHCKVSVWSLEHKCVKLWVVICENWLSLFVLSVKEFSQWRHPYFLCNCDCSSGSFSVWFSGWRMEVLQGMLADHCSWTVSGSCVVI